jgi:hypothetical protein
MSRPNRLYTIDGKYYYLKDGKRVFVKVPAGVSQKQVSKINIKNIIKLAETKRVVRKKKRRNLSYQKKIAPSMEKSEVSGLPIYFFKPKREILTIDEIANNSTDTSIDKLGKVLLKGIQATPGPTKLPAEPTIATPEPVSRSTPSTTESGFERQLERARESMEKQAKREEQEEKGKAKKPGFFKKLFTSPAKVSPMPGEKPDKYLKGEPPKMGSLEKIDEVPIGLQRTTNGKGYDSDDGLYDDEIETIATKRLKDYVPCIAKDEINQLMKYVKKGDKQFSFVVNTDNSDQPGRHWRCVYINNMDDYPSIEYFDPLTEGKPEQSLIDICRKIAIKMNPNKLFKYKQNQIRRQSKLTSNCGYHCIHFLEGRYQGIPFSEITGYDQFVEDMKKQHGELDGSGLGEKEVKPFMKAYDSYI